MSPKSMAISLIVGILAGATTGYCQQNSSAADAKLTALGEALPQKFINRAVPHDVASAILANGNTSDQVIAKMFSLYSAASLANPKDFGINLNALEKPIDYDDPGDGLVDVPGGSPVSVVYFPVHTDGYLVSGQVSGLMGRNYAASPSTFIGAATITEGGPIPAKLVYPFGNGWMFTGETIIGKAKWSFQMNPGANFNASRKYLFKFTYHHGYNTRSHWQSGFRFDWHTNTFARELDNFTRTATQGGNYYTTSKIVDYNDVPFQPRYGETKFSSQENLPIIGKGDCYLERVELHYVEPSSITNQTISFTQFYKTIPADGNVDISLPGVGVYDFDCDFIEGTTTIQNLSVTKHRETTYMATYVTPDELQLFFNGSPEYCAACMTANMSAYQNPWLDRTATWPQVFGAGSKTFFRAVIQ